MQWRRWQQGLCAAFVFSTMMDVAIAADGLPGYEAYLAQCSKCHGQMDVRASRQAPATIVAASDSVASDAQQLTFALPYGPSLRGIIGRRAGSVDGYDYSEAFLRAMSETTWDAESIDDYITDSQRRAPGARMFYRQPDASVRRRVIEFLAAFE